LGSTRVKFKKSDLCQGRDRTFRAASMVKKSKEIDPVERTQQSIGALLSRSVNVIFTNLMPVYGIVRYGWDGFIVILLFIAEAIVVFFTDVIKYILQPKKKSRGILFFEFVFIFFFGFFAILLFGREASSDNLFTTVRTAFQAAGSLPLWPIIGILIMRLLRAGQEVVSAGFFSGNGSRPLVFNGGGWMLLLFFLVMLGPFIADKSPNPTAGVIALVVLKTLGELFEVWAPRMNAAMSASASRRNKKKAEKIEKEKMDKHEDPSR